MPHHASPLPGLILLASMLIALPFALPWPRQTTWLKSTALGKFLNNFNHFWLTHQFMGTVWGILLLLHPLPGLPGSFMHNKTWVSAWHVG